MRSLLAVAEHGVVTEAAAALGVSQSALSRRVAQLEEQLGAELLEREGRGVVLTEIGRLAVEEGKLLVQRYDRLRSQVKQYQELEAGVVRIGGGATAVGYLLPHAIAEFRKQHSGVVFQVREAGSRDIEEAVLRDELELGVVTAPTRSRELVARRLAQDRIVLVAARRHRLACSGSVTAAELNAQNLVSFEAGTAVRLLVDAALRAAGIQVTVVMELRSVAAILKMVETTRGLAFVSELSVATLRRGSRSVVPLEVEGLDIVRELLLIQKPGRTLSPAARAFSRLV